MFQKYLTESMKKSPTRESQRGLTENRAVVIPARFSQRIDAHMLGNMLDIGHYPLIMAIIGQTQGGVRETRIFLRQRCTGMEEPALGGRSACERPAGSKGNPPLLLR